MEVLQGRRSAGVFPPRGLHCQPGNIPGSVPFCTPGRHCDRLAISIIQYMTDGNSSLPLLWKIKLPLKYSPLRADWWQDPQCPAPLLRGPARGRTCDSWLSSSHQPPQDPPSAGLGPGSRGEAGTQYHQLPPLVLGGHQLRTRSGMFEDRSPAIFRFVTDSELILLTLTESSILVWRTHPANLLSKIKNFGLSWPVESFPTVLLLSAGHINHVVVVHILAGRDLYNSTRGDYSE